MKYSEFFPLIVWVIGIIPHRKYFIPGLRMRLEKLWSLRSACFLPPLGFLACDFDARKEPSQEHLKTAQIRAAPVPRNVSSIVEGCVA